MLSKNQIKLITSLKQKKYRQQYGFFVVEGVKTIKELLIVWLRKENGLNDLVTSLFILFGSVQK